MPVSVGPQPQNLLSWYALRVKSRCENAAAISLSNKGYEQFLPKYQATRRWSDREKKVQLPLFPGYLFCRLNIQDRLLPVLTTPGVIGIVGAGSSPIAVPDGEIAAIQSVIRAGLSAQPSPYLAAGAKVVIERGPLKGLEGLVRTAGKVNLDNTCSLVVSVMLLQRSIAIEIQRDWVRVLGSALAEGENVHPQVASRPTRKAPRTQSAAARAGHSS